MAEQNCSSHSSSTPVIITSAAEQVQFIVDDSHSLSGSCDAKELNEKNCSSVDEKASNNSPCPQLKSKSLFSDPIITSSSDKKNGVKDTVDKSTTEKNTSVLRPSILTSGISSSSNNTESNKAGSPFSLQCPKLNLAISKFGDSSFTTSVSSSNSESSSTNSNPDTEKNNVDNTEKNSLKPTLEIFSSKLNASSNIPVSVTQKTSVISVPNFVFGQNLHERVTDSVKTANINHKPLTDIKSNGTSEMLFTSVLTSKEVKENLNNDSFCSSKDSSSLLEDAARCQEARTQKRKYEEVLITTGEEDEENVLQINVKLFAFDNGTWVERGHGILRLNDKKCDENISSRIVIRTVGNLRVVLNTKIWSKMSLNRASERSARLTAMDPNGQVKIFLIQSSLKDMTSLYSLLEERIKLCKDQELVNEGSPDKKIALEKSEI